MSAVVDEERIDRLVAERVEQAVAATLRALRTILEGSLVPIDIHLEPTGEQFYLEVTSPRGGPFLTCGISSTNKPKECLIERVEIGNQIVMRDIDVSVFNLAHIVPISLPPFSNVEPLFIAARSTRTVLPNGMPGVYPELSMTLWHADPPNRAKVFVDDEVLELLRDLQDVRTTGFSAVDALLDKLAPYLRR